MLNYQRVSIFPPSNTVEAFLRAFPDDSHSCESDQRTKYNGAEGHVTSDAPWRPSVPVRSSNVENPLFWFVAGNI